jgi:hypothetical protein
VFVAVKPATVFVSFSVTPPAEEVTKLFPLTTPFDCVMAAEDVRLILFALPAARLAPRVNAPVLLIVTLPVPDCVMTPVVNAEPFVNAIAPAPLLVAAKPVTVLALVNVVPNAELVVSKPLCSKPAVPSEIAPAVPVKLIAPLVPIVAPVIAMFRPAVAVNAPEALVIPAFTRTSLVVPFAVKEIVPVVAALIAEATVIVPAFTTEILPPPVCEIPFNDKEPELVN